MTKPLGESDNAPPVDRCPFCEDEGVESTGRKDTRVLLGGRGVYRCPRDPEHRWQDADEPAKGPGKDFIVGRTG